MRKLLVLLFFTFHFSFFISCFGQASYNWTILNSGMAGNNPVVKALVDNTVGITYDSLFAGGHFKTSGGIVTNNIALWRNDLYAWFAMGSGVDSEVDAIAQYNHKIYAGGMFDTAGGVHANYVASWDSIKWDSLLGGVNGNIYAMTVYNNALYVGGSFTMANGITVNRIAKWNDTVWSSVGSGFDSNTVYALAVYNDTLYAGGSFTKSNGKPVNYIAKWNGTTWDSVGHGMNNTVYALSVSNNLLVAGGAFTKTGAVGVNFIASSNGQLWDSIGAGVNDTVRALGPGSNYLAGIIKRTHSFWDNSFMLLAGGNFTKAWGKPIKNYAVYFWGVDTVWRGLGAINAPVYSLSPGSPNFNYESSNYIGGSFDTVNGNLNANYIAKIGFIFGSGIQSLSNNSDVNVYPNPSSGNFEFQIKNFESGKLNVQVYNVLGEQVYNSPLTIHHSPFTIDLSNQPNGVYVYRVMSNNGNLIGEGKIIIQK